MSLIQVDSITPINKTLLNMKVFIYIYCFPGIRGTEKVTSFLANALIRVGYQVRIISHICISSSDICYPLVDGIQVYNTPNKKFYSRKNKQFIKKSIKEFNPDVIILQDSTAPIAHNLFSSNLDIPVIICSHTAAYRYYSGPNKDAGTLRCFFETIFFPIVRQLKYFRDRERRRRLYDKCWRFVLLSDRLFGEFRAVARIGDTHKLRAIQNPVLGFELDPKIDNTPRQNEVIFVGALNKGKGVDLLLQAWGMVCDKIDSWNLKIIGGGPEEPCLIKQAERMGLKNVAFLGWIADPTKYYRQAKIFAFPSRGEGWGLVVTDAMYNGCVPVIMDSYSSAREIIDDQINGVIVPAFDVASFAERIIELMLNHARLDLLSRNARMKVKLYAPDIIAQKWSDLLKELPSKSG